MKIVVTGARSGLGKCIADHLRGHHFVVALTREDWDIRTPAPSKLIDKVGEADLVIHCAALTSKEASHDDYYETNVIGTKHVMEMASKIQAKDVIYLSTAAIGINDYNTSKQNAEAIVLNWNNINGHIVVPYFVYGPNTADDRLIHNIIKNVMNGIPVFIDFCRGPIQNPIYIDVFLDEIRYLIWLLENQDSCPTRIELAGNKIVTMLELIDIIAQITKKDPVINFQDVKKVTVIGTPRGSVGLEEGIRRTVEWLKCTDKETSY